MSRLLAASLVTLAKAIGAAVSFPHQPVPASFGQRIATAVEGVEKAAEGGELDGLEPGVSVAVAPTVDEIVEALLPKLAASGFIDAVAKKISATKGGDLAKDIAKAVAAEIGDGVNQALTSLGERVVELETFAEKVDGDLAKRLEALEAVATAPAAKPDGAA